MFFRLFYKFATADTAPDAQSLYDAEFVNKDGTPDRQPSVYEIDEPSVPQTHAEHAANAKISPPRKGAGIDISPTKQPGFPQANGSSFRHLASAHKILNFTTEDDLKRFVNLLFDLKVSGQARCFKNDKATIRNYVKICVANKDPEWLGFLETASVEWKKYAGVE